MLVLTRKPGQSIYIGDDVKITLIELKGNQARLGIDAPKSLKIYREEIYIQILEENKRAATAGKGDAADGLRELSQQWEDDTGKPGGKPRSTGRGAASLAAASSSDSDSEVLKKRKGQETEKDGDE